MDDALRHLPGPWFVLRQTTDAQGGAIAPLVPGGRLPATGACQLCMRVLPGCMYTTLQMARSKARKWRWWSSWVA